MNRITRRPSRQRGFTLVELLVVVVILGILSAVVVFAVRGAGDKGRGAALATDERTIRVAEEAHCAQRGTYVPIGKAGDPDGTSLVGDKFLSEPSKYNRVDVVPGGAQRCGSYSITPLPVSLTPGALECPLPGGWCPADTVADFGAMLTLPSGNVLMSGTFGMHQFDPTVGVDGKGTWLPVLPYPRPYEYVVSMVLLQQNPALLQPNPAPGEADWCGSRCGQVMVFFTGGEPWWLYNPIGRSSSSTTPSAPPGSTTPSAPPGSWTLAASDPTPCPPGYLPPPLMPPPRPPTCPPPKPYNGNAAERAAQITGRDPDCTPRCGQVFISYMTDTQLYNPIKGTFSPLERPNIPQKTNLNVTALADGRVLLTGEEYSNSYNLPMKPWTRLYNPLTNEVETPAGNHTAAHTFSSIAQINPGLVLDNPERDVLFVGRDVNYSRAAAELFHPIGNTWEDVTPPVTADWCGSKGDCFVLDKLRGGKALAFGATYSRKQGSPDPPRPGTNRPRIYLFDPGTKTWTQTGSMLKDRPEWAARISGEKCLPNCDKVITSGAGLGVPGFDSELYTPPPP